MSHEVEPKQLLHLVFGGELQESRHHRFQGYLPSSISSACIPITKPAPCAAWKAKAQPTVDNAHMRYFIVHLHRVMDPSDGLSARFPQHDLPQLRA